MTEEIAHAVTEVWNAYVHEDAERLRDAAVDLWRLTRHPYANEALAAYEEHSAEHTCGYWLDN